MKPWYLGYLSNVCIDPSIWYVCQNLARIDIVGELKLVRLLPLLFYLWHYQTPTGVNWCLMMCVACFLFPGSSAPDLWPFHNYELLLRDQGWEEGAGQKYRGRRIVRNHLMESSKFTRIFIFFFMALCCCRFTRSNGPPFHKYLVSTLSFEWYKLWFEYWSLQPCFDLIFAMFQESLI